MVFNQWKKIFLFLFSSESKSSKIVWGKSMVVSSSSSDGGIGCEPAPVMGALSNWPALSEARNVKEYLIQVMDNYELNAL